MSLVCKDDISGETKQQAEDERERSGSMRYSTEPVERRGVQTPVDQERVVMANESETNWGGSVASTTFEDSGNGKF